MSRCVCCGNPFRETDGWQDFCSVTCAMHYIVGRVVTKDDAEAESRAWKQWSEWYGQPKNYRKVRQGEPAEKPKVGRWVKRQVVINPRGGADKDVVKVIDVNIGGTMVIRPMTKQERIVSERQRGRGSFGENMVENQNWRDLPSKHGRVASGWFPHD